MALAERALNPKARRTSFDVSAECDEFHCDSLDAESCPHLGQIERPEVQEVFDSVGPRHERGCDWFRSLTEPWYSLAEALGAR